MRPFLLVSALVLYDWRLFIFIISYCCTIKYYKTVSIQMKQVYDVCCFFSTHRITVRFLSHLNTVNAVSVTAESSLIAVLYKSTAGPDGAE